MKHYPIQYLRAVAAMLVVFEHFKIYPFADNLLAGTIGIDIFYIISGFIMSLNIEKYTHNKQGFVINRFARIYPLYIILTMPLAVIYLYNHTVDIPTIFPSLYFAGSFSPDAYKDPILYSGWTLFYEFVFYGLIITFAGNRKITITILCALGMIGSVYTITNPAGYFFNQFYFLFAAGMLMNHLLKSDFLMAQSGELLLVSSVLLLSVMFFNDHAHAGDNAYIPRQYIFMFGRAIPRVIAWGVPSLFFIVSFYLFFKNRPTIGWLNQLGNMSFSIYLVHTFLFQIKNWAADNYVFLNNRMFTVFMLLLIFPVSKLTYEVIELRFNHWLKEQLS